MSKALIEIDHAAGAAYIDFGVEARGVGSALEVSATVNVDLDKSGAAVGVELLSLTPGAVSPGELLATAPFRPEDAGLIEANLAVILEFLCGSPGGAAHPAARGVDCIYLASAPAARQ